MSPRWSPLLTLLLAVSGTAALAQARPDGDGATVTTERSASIQTPDREAHPPPGVLLSADGSEAGFEAPTEGDVAQEAGADPEAGASTNATADASGSPQDPSRETDAAGQTPEVTVTSAARTDPPQLHRVELIDGQSLVGILRSHDAHGVMLEIGDGPRIYLSRSTITKVSPEETTIERPLRPQVYFFAPTAMLLKEGQGSFAQIELLLSEFSYGITDNLNFSIGSVLPFWFANAGAGFNVLATVKAGASVNEVLHLAAGVYGLFVPAALNTGVAALGVGFGTVTLGTAEQSLSVSIGVPVVADGPTGGVLFNLSGSKRVSRLVAITGELWSFPTGGSTFNAWMLGGGTRLDLRPFSVDVGVYILGQGGAIVPVPIPWLSAAYNFG